MASSVTAPLERNFGEIPGLLQMTSTSSFGSSLVTLQFNLDLNIDVAEQEVQAEINSASNLLPKDLPNPPVYSKINPADAPILTLALTSQTLLLSKVEDLHPRWRRKSRNFRELAGQHQRRSGLPARAGESYCASFVVLSLKICTAGKRERRSSQRTLTGSKPIRLARMTSCFPAGLSNIVIAFRNGAPVRFSDVAFAVDGAVCGSGMGQQATRRHPEHSRPRRKHHRGGRPGEGYSSAVAGSVAGIHSGDDLTDRTAQFASVADVQPAGPWRWS
jgi:multidrug efflux pump